MPEAFYQVPVLGRVRLELPELPALLSLQAHVPGICDVDSGPANMALTYAAEQTDILRDEGQHIRLGGPWSDSRVHDTPHLLYALCRRAWLELGYGLFHAAALQVPSDEAILLAGHSGAGKTTLCEHMRAQDAFKMLSGNKTLVQFVAGQANVIAGTPVSSVLHDDGTRQQSLAQQGNLPARIKAVALVRLNDGVSQWQQLLELSASHALLPLCLDSVNADILTAGTALFDGGVSSGAKQKVADGLRESLPRIPVYRAVGSLACISKQVRDLA